MNFALVGDSPLVLPLAAALAEHPRHRLAAAALTGAITSQLVAAVPSARRLERWETLLVDRSIDAVIACGTANHLQEAIRQLAAEGTPLLLLPHAELATFYYELSLVRDDAGTLLAPAFPLAFAEFAGLPVGDRTTTTSSHAVPRAVERESDDSTGNELGRVMHLAWEREAAIEGRPPLLTAAMIDEALLSDCDALRRLGGNYDRVTAVRTGVIDSRAAMATATLAGDGLPEATWTLRAVRPDPARPTWNRWTLTASGSTGTRVVSSDRAPESNPWAMALDAFASGVRGEPRGPAWGDLIRACDIVDAARRSVARRRTIDIHFETTSERSQFKTQMTAIGCGVLILTLLLVLGLMLFDQMVQLPPNLRLVARIAVFLPLFAFLALQALIVLARPSSRD